MSKGHCERKADVLSDIKRITTSSSISLNLGGNTFDLKEETFVVMSYVDKETT